MKQIFFWPYQLYAWLILWPLAAILTLLFSALAVLFSVLVSPRFASRVKIEELMSLTKKTISSALPQELQ